MVTVNEMPIPGKTVLSFKVSKVYFSYHSRHMVGMNANKLYENTILLAGAIVEFIS
jgi:hypothetical protein